MFRNEYYFNEKVIKEYVYGVLFRKGLIMGAVIFVIGLALFFVYNTAARYFMLVMGILCMLSVVIIPVIYKNKLVKLTRDMHGGKEVITYVEFNEDEIVMTEGDDSYTFSYDELRSIKETKNIISVLTNASNAIIITKDGFTEGTLEDFRPFILSKVKK